MANTSDYDIVNGNNVYGLRALSMQIVSTLLNSCGILAALGIMNANKMDTVFDVGTPSLGAALSGATLSPTMNREIMECSQYSTLIESIFQYDVKNMGYRDTTATLAQGSGATIGTITITNGVIISVAVSGGGTGFAGSPPTLIPVDVGGGQGAILLATIAGGQLTAITVQNGGFGYSGSTTVLVNTGYTAGQKAARSTFKWTHDESVGYVYWRDVRRSDTLATQQTRMLNTAYNNELVMTEQKNVISGQIQRMAGMSIFGTPTSQTADLWDQPFGLDAMIDSNNNYAGIDRSLDANYYWRSLEDTSAHVWTLEQLWADAHMTKGLAFKGGANAGLDVFFVNPILHAKFMAESQAYTINANTDPNIQILKRVYGFSQITIKYNNTYVIPDVRVPLNTVYGLNTKSIIWAFRNGAKFNLGPLNDQRKVLGGIDAQTFLCDTQYMLINQAPALSVKYTAVS